MQSAVNAQPSEIRVLLVEDGAESARALTAQLARSGLRVVHERVDNAEDMRKVLLTADWDIVLCARSLRRFDFRTALSVLQSSGRDIPLVAYTGHVTSNLAPAAARPAVSASPTLFDQPRIVTAPAQALRELAGSRGSPLRPGLGEGLLNGTRFLQVAPDVLDERRPGEQAAVCRVDFSRLGRVNQVFGRAAADALLAQIGRRIGEHAHAGVAARLGASEFVVLQGGLENADAVQRHVQALSGALAQPYEYRGLEVHISTSMGVAVVPESGMTLPELMLNAQTALQQCRRLMGRDAYLLHFAQLKPLPGEHMLLESALFEALRRDELRLFYQPCVAIGSGRVTSVEAFLRWQHPELGLLAPDRFIALAQECGLMPEIDAWVLREAAWQSRFWRADGHSGFTVAVNVSASQLGQPALLGNAATALRETGIAADTLEIDVTESALVTDATAAVGTLQSLRKLGVRVAIDDFGTGHSSLAQLKRFPVDVLKIDPSFVRNIGVDGGRAEIAQEIIELAQDLDLTVHAEGVETRQQLEILAERGCDRAQGYLFARPVPAEQLISLVGRLEADAACAPPAAQPAE